MCAISNQGNLAIGCYDCGGIGTRGTETVKLYSAERLAKLNAAKAKADARRAAIAQAKAEAHAAEVAARADAFRIQHASLIERSAPHMTNTFIGDVMGRAIRECQITPGQVDAVLAAVERIEREAALRASSDYVGKPGERLTLAVTVERALWYERPAFNAPWTTTVVHIVTMRDAAGNAIVSKGRFTAEKGEQLTIKATVKEHALYKDERQTVVQRVAVKS